MPIINHEVVLEDSTISFAYSEDGTTITFTDDANPDQPPFRISRIDLLNAASTVMIDLLVTIKEDEAF